MIKQTIAQFQRMICEPKTDHSCDAFIERLNATGTLRIQKNCEMFYKTRSTKKVSLLLLLALLLSGNNNGLSLLLGGSGDSVEQLLAVNNDGGDETLAGEMANADLGQATVDTERLRDTSSGDDLHLGYLLQQFVVSLLVVDNLVGQLLLDAALRPLLLTHTRRKT